VPIFFLLMFVGVFGNTIRAGLTGASIPGRHYIDYLAPGIFLMTAGASAAATAVGICTDMKEGIIARFRTMAITRASVLTGQVLGAFIRTLISGVLVVAVALALGFRPTATPVEWLAAAGMFAGLTLALTWLAVAFGLFAKTPEGANSLSLIMLVLPFVSSAFVPPTRCRPECAGSPTTNPSHRSSTPCAACSPARRSGTAPPLPPRGAPASPPSATVGPQAVRAQPGPGLNTWVGLPPIAPTVSGGRGPEGAGPLRTLRRAGGGAGRLHPWC